MNYEHDPYFKDPAYKAANDVYSLYFIGWLIGFATFIIGLVIAERHRRRHQGFTSHFLFQRTMAWQGLVLLGLWVAALIGYTQAFPEGWWVLKLSLIASMIGLLWWWLRRNFAGYRLLSQRLAVVNPHTWGVPYGHSQSQDRRRLRSKL